MALTRIYWLLEESLSMTHPRNWSRVGKIYENLIQLVGNPELQHVFVDPRIALGNLRRALGGLKPSTIICMSNWLPEIVRSIFPGVSVLRVHLSRIFEVSSGGVSAAGYLANLRQADAQRLSQRLDLKAPLLVDDTVVSGGTIRTTWNRFMSEPSTGSVACLMAERAAIRSLGSLGIKTVYGKSMEFPREDAWHLNDLLVSERDLAALEQALRFGGTTPESLLAEKVFSGERALELSEAGVFVHSEPLSRCGYYAKNPRLWFRPNFLEQVDVPQIVSNWKGIESILTELRRLVNVRHRKAAIRELVRC